MFPKTENNQSNRQNDTKKLKLNYVFFFRITTDLSYWFQKGKVVSGQAGEDGDFIQLRVVQERVCIVEITILK